jgi:hypothetical protein
MDSAGTRPDQSSLGAISAGAMGLWLAVQLLALIAAAARVRLWASFPATGETLAADELIVVQFIASALLITWMPNNISAAAAMIVSIWPMLALAGLLSAIDWSDLAVVGGYVSLWIAALGAARLSLKSELARRILATAATLLTLGGPILGYVRSEFGSSAPSAILASLPLPSALSHMHAPPASPISWLMIASPLAIPLWKAVHRLWQLRLH